MNETFDQKLIDAQVDRLVDAGRFQATLAAIDSLNNEDPNRAELGGQDVGYELYFGVQLFARVLDLAADASEALMLAARSQHICRWTSPRSDYPMDRAGYLKWRAELKVFHARKAAEVLEEKGYDAETIERVKSLNLKKNLRSDVECQVLEDALCVVFLEKQFAKFSEKTDEEKMISILQKTWGKMSEAGRSLALTLHLGDEQKRLVEKALL